MLTSTVERLALVVAFISLINSAAAFDPYQYSRKTVQCDAIQREPVPEQVKIKMSYIDIGDTSHDTIIMSHGWPSIWSTWAKQIEAFQDDYHLLVPDLRGFGQSSHPDDIKSSHTLFDIVNDLVCVLEDAKVSSAVCLGHDWGTAVCYEAARMRPDIFKGVIGLVIPYIPAAGPYVSVKELLPVAPKLSYQSFFDRQTREAAQELVRDTRRTMRATLRTVSSPPPDQFLESETSFLVGWEHVEEIPPIPFFTSKEEDYIVEAYEKRGFLYTLGFYTEESRKLSHAFSNEQGNLTLPQPVLSVLPTKDPVADWAMVMKMFNSSAYIQNLVTKFVEGAHWVHIENPDPVNEAIRGWLKLLPATRAAGHLDDEL